MDTILALVPGLDGKVELSRHHGMLEFEELCRLLSKVVTEM